MSKTERAVVRYGRWVLRRRAWVIAATLLTVLALGAGAPHLGFNDDYRLFFAETDPELQAFEALQAIYTKNDNILFVIEPADGEVFTAETLGALEQLTEGAWQIPFARRVDSVTNFQHTRADGDDLVVEDLVSGSASLTPGRLAEVRDIALAEPLLNGRLVSSAADVTGVNVTLQMPGESVDESSLA
ncbi:MAG: hypothetical protein AAFY88_11370, partial [Acidobacteriota bacterium]